MNCELGDVRQYCAEGMAEAEACGDVEMQAEFLMQGVLLNMMEGRPVDEIKEYLQVNIFTRNTVTLNTGVVQINR